MANDTKDIIINIKAETSKATSEIKKLNTSIKKLEAESKKSDKAMTKSSKSVKSLGASFQTLGQHLARLVVIYGSFTAISSTIKAFASFEQAIVTLGAISGATGEELEALEAKALSLGESTIFSASQVAEGMTEMARAGLSASEQLAGIEGVLNLSINGMVSLSESSKIATTAMNSFGLEASDIPMIVDIMSTSINSSSQNLTQLGNALGKVTPVAKSMGLSIQETIATLGILADAGRRGAEAGTQLKISLLRLGATPEAKKYIDELGISMFKADGTLKSFTEQLTSLASGLKGLSQEAQLTAKTRIFGTEALASGEIMLDNIDKIIKSTALLNTSFGYAEINAQKMMDTLQGSYKELLSALEGLQIRIGENLSPALRTLIEDATEFIRTIDADDINEFSDAIASLVEGVIDIGHYLSATVTVLKQFDKATNDVGVEVLALTILVVKFRKELKLLLLSMARNPATAVFVATLALMTEHMISNQKALDDMARSNKTFEDSFGGLSKAINTINVALDSMSSGDAQASLTQLLTASKNTEKGIVSLQLKLQKLQDEYAKFSNTSKRTLGAKQVADEIAKLELRVKSLVQTYIYSKEVQESLMDVGRKLIAIRNKELIAMNKLGSSYTLLSEKAKVLEGVELKAHTKMLANLTQRESKLSSALDKMKSKELQYASDLKRIDQDIANARARHAENRLDQELNHKLNIDNLRASLLNDLGQYNDAQKRADIELSLSKKASLAGDLAGAERHFEAYMQLIKVNANAEIKIGENVVKTKSQIVNERIKDEIAGNEQLKRNTALKDKQEIDALKAKRSLIEANLALQKLQIEVQLNAIEMMSKMIEALTGMGYEDTFNQFKAKAKASLAEIDALIAKGIDYEIDIKLNESGLNSDLASVKTKVNNTTLTPKATIDMTEPEGKITEFTRRVNEESPEIDVLANTDKAEREIGDIDIETIPFDADGSEAQREIERVATLAKQADLEMKLEVETAEAQAEVKRLQALGAEDVTSVHHLDLVKAYRDYNKLASLLRKNTFSTHTIRVTKVYTNSTGGFIPTQESIPKFADGGFTEKSGKLGGYGGGDKIKALLEAGEFIIRKESVKKLGLDRLNQINDGQLPKFKHGGSVSPIPRFATGGSVTSTTPNKTVNLNLNIGGETFKMMSDEDVANSLANYLERSEF